MRLMLWNIRYASGHGPQFHFPLPGAGHRFGGQDGALHQTHLVNKDSPDCGFCHPTGDAQDTRHRAACYNCHASGHRP